MRAPSGAEQDVSSAKKAVLDRKRADLRAAIVEAQQELLQVEKEEALLAEAEQLPGAASGEGEASPDDKLLAASSAAARGLVERLEAQLSLNRTLLVEITSEEKDLEAQKEQLEESASGLHQAFKVALDTPLQSAIYTIQQLLHEDGIDAQTAAGLSTILKELTAANPYLPTFNFSGSDLADDTKVGTLAARAAASACAASALRLTPPCASGRAELDSDDLLRLQVSHGPADHHDEALPQPNGRFWRGCGDGAGAGDSGL